MIKFFPHFYFLSFFISISALAKDTTNNFSFSGHVDTYGAYYTDSVGINNYQKFLTVSTRSQQIGINIAMLTSKYTVDYVRGVITLHYGDIPKISWCYHIILSRKQMQECEL